MTERTPGHPDTGQAPDRQASGHLTGATTTLPAPVRPNIPEQRTPGQADPRPGKPTPGHRTGTGQANGHQANGQTGARSTTTHSGHRTGEPRLASIASWVVLLASFGLSASTWVHLGQLAGFDDHWTLHGQPLWLDWLMPAAMDGYVVIALVLWMAPVPAKVAAFARANTYAAAAVGVVAQSLYHAFTTWQGAVYTWQIPMAAAVGALPPAVAALTVHMRALIRRESGRRPLSAGQVTAPPATGHAPAGQVSAGITVRTLTPNTRAAGQVPAVTGQRTTATTPATPTRTGAAPDTGQANQPDTNTALLPQPDSGQADTAPVVVDEVTAKRRQKADSGQRTEPSVEEMADSLGVKFGTDPVGKPTAMAYLKAHYGACSGDRAIAAKNLHNQRITQKREEAAV